MAVSVYVFQKYPQFFLVEIAEDGTVALKIKEDGWSDTWSRPLEKVEL